MEKQWKRESKNNKTNKYVESILKEWQGEYWKFKSHAVERCLELDITRDEVIECLQYGKVSPHPDYDNQEVAKIGRLRVIFDGSDIITVFLNDCSKDKFWDKSKVTKGQRKGMTRKNRKNKNKKNGVPKV